MVYTVRSCACTGRDQQAGEPGVDNSGSLDPRPVGQRQGSRGWRLLVRARGPSRSQISPVRLPKLPVRYCVASKTDNMGVTYSHSTLDGTATMFVGSTWPRSKRTPARYDANVAVAARQS